MEKTISRFVRAEKRNTQEKLENENNLKENLRDKNISQGNMKLCEINKIK